MKRGANDMLNTFKHYVSMLLDVLAACLMLIAASMFKTLAPILGPDMLKYDLTSKPPGTLVQNPFQEEVSYNLSLLQGRLIF